MTTHDEEQLERIRRQYEQEADDLREKLAKKKAKLKAAQARISARISARERKRRTRRLILIGSVVKSKADQDSRTRLWLLQALDEALERTQDRELFDLDPKKENGKAPSETPPQKPPPPVPGWRPHHLKTGAWGSIYLGDTSALPSELVDAHITVQSKDGESWTTTVTAVLERSSEQVIVTNSGRLSTL